MTIPNNYAFPVALDFFAGGLTKREYFAAMAMQGLLSNPNTSFETRDAVIIADALIAELNK
jgi:hypothetical protein